jgi:hypothetical protein
MVRLMVTFGTGLWPHGRSKFSKQSNSLICRRCRHQSFSASYEMMAEWVAKKAVSNITLPLSQYSLLGYGVWYRRLFFFCSHLTAIHIEMAVRLFCHFEA